jgi:hypothetical protein
MLDTLRFVRGAVSDSTGSGIIPVLTHFCIYDGRIRGADSRVTIDAACPELAGINTVVPAEPFLRGIDACNGEPTFRFTEGGKLVVERKPFRAQLPVRPVADYPLEEPSKGRKFKLDGEALLDKIARLRPFISNDAERPWASTMYFGKDAAYAASNAMIAMIPSGIFSKAIQLPIFCVDELLRIERPPAQWSDDDHSVTFTWENGDWLRAQKITQEWPTATAEGWFKMKERMVAVPEGLLKAVDRIRPFCHDPKRPIIYLTDGGISTAPGEMQAEVAGFKVGTGAFHADNLKTMLGAADKMAISEKAALFSGPQSFRGVMALLKM